jgi:hypothetical protein
MLLVGMIVSSQQIDLRVSLLKRTACSWGQLRVVICYWEYLPKGMAAATAAITTAEVMKRFIAMLVII